MINFAVDPQFHFDSEEYLRLFKASSASAFQHPVWLNSFCRNLVEPSGCEMHTVTGRDETGALALVVPLIRWQFQGPVKLEYAFLGVTDYACPVISNAHREVIEEDSRLAQKFKAAVGSCVAFNVGPVHQEHLELWHSLLGVEANALDFGAHAVYLGTPFDAWRKKNLGAARAGAVSRKARRLADRGMMQLREVAPDEIFGVFCEAQELRRGRFPNDPLQEPAGLAFYEEVARLGRASGFARTYRLTSGESTVAVLFGIADLGRFYYIILACNYAEFSRYSPGLVILDMVMADWASSGGTTFDFTIGDEAFKAEFGCRRTPMYEFRMNAQSF